MHSHIRKTGTVPHGVAGGAFIPSPYIFYFQSLFVPTVWIFETFLYQHRTINSAVLSLENE